MRKRTLTHPQRKQLAKVLNDPGTSMDDFRYVDRLLQTGHNDVSRFDVGAPVRELVKQILASQ